MQVLINGEKRDIPNGISVKSLLKELEIEPETVVVELNGSIVKPPTSAAEAIPAGAGIEIVRFVGGGR